MNNPHADCPLVKDKTRKDLSVKCSKEELDSMKLIQTKIKCSDQAISLLKVPEGTTKEEASAFIQGALEYKSVAVFLHDTWWDDMMNKYDLKKLSSNSPVFLDFSDGSFYTME